MDSIPGSAAGAAHYRGSRSHIPAANPPTGRLRVGALATLLVFALTACGHAPVRQPGTAHAPPSRHWTDPAPADPVRANAVLMRAISLVGTPYRYGGNTPDGGFDCSGLVTYVYRDMLDLRLPRTSRELAAWQGPRIPEDRLSTADLVFFGQAGQVSHVGIYVGEGRFVHAPSTGGTVRLDRLDGPYWREHYTGARRVLH
jgi:cell wall-associated NlpC family hydrolase